MKTICTCLAICICFHLSAQEKPGSGRSSAAKGILPVRATLAVAPATNTYAVVVGISDYQDEDTAPYR